MLVLLQLPPGWLCFELHCFVGSMITMRLYFVLVTADLVFFLFVFFIQMIITEPLWSQCDMQMNIEYFCFVFQEFNEMGDMGAVNPYLATALRGYKTALDAALSAASWLAQPGPGGSFDGGRPPADRSSRSDGIEVCEKNPDVCRAVL
jgi:hypothetical protein